MIITKFIPSIELRREIESIIADSELFEDFDGVIRFYDGESVYLEGNFAPAQLILLVRILMMFEL